MKFFFLVFLFLGFLSFKFFSLLDRNSNVKLPKYLEREKREKELQRIQELKKDTNCPKGFYALDEKERLETLNTAKESK